MPYATSFDLARRLYFGKLYGVVTLAELNALTAGMHTVFPPGESVRVLSDLREADLRTLKTADLLRYGEALNSKSHLYRGRRQMALIAASDLQFGLARIFEKLCEPLFMSVAVFRTESEALGWLGVSLAELPRLWS